ncbi:CFEM domain-containing protein [Colletotrichum karsti]|uniref:CFEM domain-containing protein n=1 Tax=Colletotrichum karsti TaxID=1095194 RepID=A0A9P6IE34_9PEZI|nr:CFEM domain-containing protein [Colletotrichum karsti]KAF9878841.1 CFEM domain-containing protein [Colletotrichum karsti]
MLLPTLSMILRMAVKAAGLSRWGADDTTIVLAYCVTLGFISADMLWESYGLGKDLWTLSSDQITSFFQDFYILQCLYNCVITLVKTSILFMFLRIFPDQKFRLVVWATQIFNLTVGVIFLLISLFQCRPINLAWRFWTGENDGQCISIGHVGMVQGTIYVLMDVWMLILPATQVWGLNMKRRKKFAVMFMFSLGLFLTVVSIIRIVTIKDLSKYPLNPTVAIIPAGIWTNIEVYVAVFTANIPNIRQFIWGFIIRRSEKEGITETEPEASHEKSPRRPPKTLTMELNETMDQTP